MIDSPAFHQIVRPHRWPWLWYALVAVSYVFTGRLGLLLGLAHENVSAVWPPTGIAIASILLLGWRAAIPVYIGAFAVNALTEVGYPLSALIALGNTLEAIVAVALMHAITDGQRVFERIRNVAKYVGVVAPLATMVSATIGASALLLGGVRDVSFLDLWLTWWTGDLVGALVIMPLIVLWFGQPFPRLEQSHAFEAIGLLGLSVVTGLLLYGGIFPQIFDQQPLGFLILPSLAWAAFRFGRRGVVAIGVLFTFMALYGTLNAHGPYFRGDLNRSLVTVQLFSGIIITTMLIVAVLVRQFRHTQEMQRETRAGLEMALATGNMGAWEWDIRSGRVKWSKHLEVTHGLQPGAFRGTFEDFQRDIHPQDLAEMRDRIMRAVSTGEPYHTQYRIIRPDATVAWLEARGELIRDAHGPIRMTGICTDITKQRQAERRLTAEHAITRVLSESASLHEAAPGVIRAFCQALDGEVGALWLPDEKHEELICAEIWTNPKSTRLQPFIDATQRVRFRRGVGLPGRVWSGESTATIVELLDDLNFPRRESARQSGLHSGFAFPITSGNEFLGVVEFFTSQRIEADESLLQMMTAIGRDIGQFIHRHRTEQQLRQSESLHQAILVSALDAIISMDQSGKVVEWNAAAERTFGYMREEAVGTELAELIIPAHLRTAHRTGLATFTMEKRSRLLNNRIEMPARHAAGRDLLIELAITASTLNGQVVFTAHARDITSLAKSMQDQRLLASMVNSSDDTIIFKNLDGIILTWNAGAERTFGYTAAQAIGQSITMLIPPERLAEEMEILRRLSNGEHIHQYETERVARDGTRIDVSLSVSPVKDATGSIIGASKIARDISEKKRIERELEHHRNRLEELVAERTAALEASQLQIRVSERMTALGTLSTGIGHDIGNLLLPMRSRLDVLKAMDLTDDAKQHVQAIEFLVQHLYTLVRGLRLMAQDPQHMEGEPYVELKAWADEVLPLFQSMVHEQVQISVQFPPDLPPAGIPSHVLTQAVRNLIKNSRDAIGLGKAGRIVFRADLIRDDTIRLAVIDDGAGMTPDVKARALEPFFTTKKRSLSTGLGLSTTHGILRNVNAEIELRSPVPQELRLPNQDRPGAAILLLLPVAEFDQSDHDADQSPRTATVSVADPRSRSVLNSVLQSIGLQVQLASNGDPGKADVWVFDATAGVTTPHAQQFLQGGENRMMYAIGEVSEELRSLGVKSLDPSCKPSAIRAAFGV